jgi:hypothetical protein
MDKKVYDRHTLYILSGPLEEEEIMRSLRESLSSLPSDCANTKIYINTIRSFRPSSEENQVVLIGVSYAHINSQRAFNALIGLNLDGSKRVEHRKNSTEKDEEPWNIGENDGRAWSDMIDDEPQVEEITLEPLVCPMAEINGVIKPLEISPAFVETDPELSMNTICIRNVPHDITPQMLKEIFKEYSYTTINPRKTKQKNIVESYPFITITPKRRGYVTFDPRTNDGAFALLMTKRILIGSHVLHCNHPVRKCRE